MQGNRHETEIFRASNGLYVSRCPQKGIRVSSSEGGYKSQAEFNIQTSRAFEEFILWENGFWQASNGVLINKVYHSDRINVFDPDYEKFGMFFLNQIGTPRLSEYFDRWGEAALEWKDSQYSEDSESI